MNKVLLIIQREYMTRVRKKAFIVTTLLVPGLFLLMYGIIFLIFTKSDDLNKERTVFVSDQSSVFKGKFHDERNLKFKDAAQSIDVAKTDLRKREDDFLLLIPKNYAQKGAIQIYSMKKPNFTIAGSIQDQMNAIAKDNIMVTQGIDTAKFHQIKSDINITPKQLTDKGEENSSIGAAYGAGLAGAILIYITLMIYGAQVMRGVIEEKSSRIIEVVISSVKPFQLMLGKIIGVGLVGLTQFLLWIVLTSGVTVIAGGLLASNQSVSTTQVQQIKKSQPVQVHTSPTVSTKPAPPAPSNPGLEFYNSMKTIPFGYILGWFLFYFLTGFFLYSALFAAIGSAVDSETETQQFMFPVTLPLLFTYMLSFSYLIMYPDSTLATWLSIIPFTAPVAMMVRIPFVVPWWQLAISAVMMIGGFLFTTWVASRIYRVGILMYGKKASFKEIRKWFFYKE